MNKTTVITLAGGIAMMLAFGIGVAKTAGPCMVGPDYDKAPAASSRTTAGPVQLVRRWLEY